MLASEVNRTTVSKPNKYLLAGLLLIEPREETKKQCQPKISNHN